MENTRRNFCKKSLLALAVVPLAGVLSKDIFAQTTPTIEVDGSKNPMVAAVGYVSEASKSDKRKDSTQFCKGCALFQKGELKAAEQKGEYGVCALFQDGLVAANGWCQSWVAKPVQG